MQDTAIKPPDSLSGLAPEVWRGRLHDMAQASGGVQPLGSRHFGVWQHGGPILLVTFESERSIRALAPQARPFGFDLAHRLGWGGLSVISDGDTWFRAPEIFDFFDDLSDDGTFDGYDHVLFYGAGPGGYAAAAFSVAAPGATVLCVQPQATLEPRLTEWDDRFRGRRRPSFTDRYGYAPDMIEAARQAFVLYDPREPLDAMHAALFRRANVTRIRLPFLGAALQHRLVEMDLLDPLLTLAGTGGLTDVAAARLFRARRTNRAYLRNLLGHLDAEERPHLARLLCRNVSGRLNAPRFRRRLAALEAELAGAAPADRRRARA